MDTSLWEAFRASAPWRALRRVAFLRSALHLAIELHRSWREPRSCSWKKVDDDLVRAQDPWRYESSPLEQERFRQQTAMIDSSRGVAPFPSGLEIGCAEGLYTEVLARRCDTLLVLDLSPTALARARARRQWPDSVRFQSFDLRTEEIPGRFDLVVVTGVLEYFSRRSTMARVRGKLAAALLPGGLLLVETTRSGPIIEDSWWGRALPRGRWINAFVARHPSLAVVSESLSREFAITLYRKAAEAVDPC